MFKTLRSRLWIGYSLLILFVLGAFFLGLFITLNRTSALYRQVELQMRLEEQLVLRDIAENTNDPLPAVSSFAATRPESDTVRILLLDYEGNTLYDSDADTAASIEWKSLVGIRRTDDQTSSRLVRDTRNRFWLYTIRRLTESKRLLVIAAPRGNLTLKFMLSDPMTRMTLFVALLGIAVSLLLTLLMDRWLAEPIRRMSATAKNMAVMDQADIPLEGPEEIQDLAQSLNHMHRQVKESQQSQRDFISDVSHELKTPLTSIQGFANAVLDGTANDEKSIRHAVEVISNESNRMLRLVLDLLTLTRLEGGVESMTRASVDLNILTMAVVDKLSLTANQRQITLVNEVGDLPRVIADSDRITQVITNLVDNAIKYSNPGSQVTLTSSRDEQGIRINVADQGIGISEKDLPRIFDRFFQADKSRTGGTRKSSGLGLPIARQIARAHGGDILVQSQPGKGTVFTLFLPAAIIR